MAREGAEPILLAHDVRITRAFYESLGFTAGYHDDRYEILRRDDLVVHLERREDLDPAANTTSCYWRVPDADALYREFATVGLPSEGSPRLTAPSDEPWGMREFTLKDPAGNLIRVGHELHKHSNVPTQRVMPALRITNYERSKAFYVGGLGFRIDWEHRFGTRFPVFMQVSRDGLAFFLTEHAGDCPPGGVVHLYVADVDAWFSDLEARGAPVKEGPNESLQGLRSMTIVDPDGNKLMFHTRLPGWRR